MAVSGIRLAATVLSSPGVAERADEHSLSVSSKLPPLSPRKSRPLRRKRRSPLTGVKRITLDFFIAAPRVKANQGRGSGRIYSPATGYAGLAPFYNTDTCNFYRKAHALTRHSEALNAVGFNICFMRQKRMVQKPAVSNNRYSIEPDTHDFWVTCQLTDLVYDGVFEVLQWLLFLSAVPPVQLRNFDR